MNCIPDELYMDADLLFSEGLSIREVAHRVGIAKETAHRIQKYGRLVEVFCYERPTVVLSGARQKDGTHHAVSVSQVQPQWRKQHHGNEADLVGVAHWKQPEFHMARYRAVQTFLASEQIGDLQELRRRLRISRSLRFRLFFHKGIGIGLYREILGQAGILVRERLPIKPHGAMSEKRVQETRQRLP